MTQDLTVTAKQIIKSLGGAANIKLLTHCVTRLRFSLLDDQQVDATALNEITGVLGSQQAAGQYQVVVGPTIVTSLCQELDRQLGGNKLTQLSSKAVQASHHNFFQHGLTVFADIFIPILPVIVGAGILLGLGTILTTPLFGQQALVHSFPQIKGLTEMITLVANTAFTYIPVLVAWSTTKRFGGKPVFGIVLGLVLVNAQLLPGSQLSSVLNGQVTPTTWDLFGLRIDQIGYQNSVLPPLLAAILLVQIEKFLEKRLPPLLQTIVVAPVAIFVAAFFTFLVLGPLGNLLSNWIAEPLIGLFKIQPLLAGLIFGMLWEPLVVTGLHYAFIAINIQMVAQTQQSQMIAIIATICMAEAGADLAIVWLRHRQHQPRGIALSAGISALLGITEPSLFGVTIPQRYPFICAIATGGLAGMLVSLSGEYAVSVGPAGPLSLVVIPVQFWPAHLLILVITFSIGFLSTAITGKILAGRHEFTTENINLNE